MIPTIVWEFISMFADVRCWIGLTVGFVIIYSMISKPYRKRVRWVFCILIAVLASYLISFLLKMLFQVPRPCLFLDTCPSTPSFPSGHATVIFAFATVMVLNAKKNKLYLLAVPLAILVSMSRIFLNYHTPIDIIAGMLIGTFFGFVVHRMKRFMEQQLKIIFH